MRGDRRSQPITPSTPQEQLDQLAVGTETLGITATRLRVPYPFHNRLLAVAEHDFSERIADVPRHTPYSRIYSPLLSRYIDGVADVDALVVGHLTTPARFSDAVRTVHADGVTRFIKSGAKKAQQDRWRRRRSEVAPQISKWSRASSVTRKQDGHAAHLQARLVTVPDERYGDHLFHPERTDELVRLRSLAAAYDPASASSGNVG